MRADRYPANVPKARWIICSGKLGRLGLISPCEFLAGQQLALSDFLSNADQFVDLLSWGSYLDLMKWGGNSFHVGSAGHYSVAVLLLPRFANLGVVVPSDS